MHAGGRVLLRSRQGTDMTGSFPEIRAAILAQLHSDTGLDGELVVWESERLAFERLQQRLARRGKGAREAAGQRPAHYVAFDLVHVGGTDLTGWPYRRRRAALEALFAEHGLAAPLTLCLSTTDPAVAAQWLTWTAAGMEGLCFKRLDEPYLPVRSWRKYKVRVTSEAIIGAVTGSLAAPRTALLGRYDRAGRLQYTGRSTTPPGQPAAPWLSCSPHPRTCIPGRGGHSARSLLHRRVEADRAGVDTCRLTAANTMSWFGPAGRVHAGS
ncbi:ATP-dependent DNA ligase [Streptomyces massasporeus]|uniref:ATP-dependent DNA ligase n=1 Tax=Streptomyces massasporeus TaxID=67324 RepID=UPI003452BCD1